MRFKKFLIRNFKGVREAEIEVESRHGARIFTLVGLNESGKTTILEAIHSFSPDADTQIVVGNVSSVEEQRTQRVPRHRISDFSGDVSVTATLEFEGDEKSRLYQKAAAEEVRLDINQIPDEFKYERIFSYKNGDFVGAFYRNSIEFTVKTGRQRNFREPNTTEKTIINNALQSMFPVIAYFPTFVFDFPEKIYLSRKSSRTNSFYRKLFQDILDFDGRNLTIEKHIINRLRKEEYIAPWATFWPAWHASNEQDKIDQVVARASQVVTRVVFGRWNEVFNEDPRNKEVEIEWHLEEGLEIEDEDGNSMPSEEHDIYVKFRIKHGTQKFDVKDRSLGFRWFFTFLLFTQFRAVRDDNRPIVFLFDEPASNLHAAAQQKLIESFPEIAKPPHLFIYSTHSHYMIEPKWLEQAYIVQNDANINVENFIDGATKEDESINITVTPYKRFVSQDPNDVSYFQPIIDRLEVVPSKFDIDRGGVLLEGKSDYYILRYLSEMLFGERLRLFPALGAGTMDALISIQKGWGLPVRVILDSDRSGQKELGKYMDLYCLNEKEITLLSGLLSELTEIENILTQQDMEMIKSEFNNSGKLSKKQILRFFQQKLASRSRVNFSKEFMIRGEKLVRAIKNFSADSGLAPTAGDRQQLEP